MQTVANPPITPPDTPGLIKKARHNGITGQINDPLMKSPTKQAKTARPTYVFHHAIALTFPLAQPPWQAQLGRGRVRKGGEKWLCALTTLSPYPPKAPFQTFGRTKASVAILCCSDPPNLTHTPVLQELKKAAAAPCSWGCSPCGTHLLCSSVQELLHPSLCLRDKCRNFVWLSQREGHRTTAAAWIGANEEMRWECEEEKGQLLGGPTPPTLKSCLASLRIWNTNNLVYYNLYKLTTPPLWAWCTAYSQWFKCMAQTRSMKF